MLLEKLSDTFHNSIDQSKVSFGLFFTVKKAFITMNNDIPFNKLYRTVSANHFLLFFKVTFGIVLKRALGSVLSDSISFKRGGLQRSTLTPLFFNLCFNGFATLVETSKIYQFADDYLMVSGN